MGRSDLAGGKMPICRAALSVSIIVAVSLLANAMAFAALSATADVSTSSTTSPYSYTITLHNTGDTNIGTLWFAWDAETDFSFLPTVPTNITAPSGWISPISAYGGDGYGIEYYNLGGSPIASGGTGIFHFASTDSPATLAGNAYSPGFKVTSTFVYIGFPESDPGFQLNASVTNVPEPGSIILSSIGAGFCWLISCRRSR
jgi:hypothetical protein